MRFPVQISISSGGGDVPVILLLGVPLIVSRAPIYFTKIPLPSRKAGARAHVCLFFSVRTVVAAEIFRFLPTHVYIDFCLCVDRPFFVCVYRLFLYTCVHIHIYVFCMCVSIVFVYWCFFCIKKKSITYMCIKSRNTYMCASAYMCISIVFFMFPLISFIRLSFTCARLRWLR